jgi:hypothetical protein
MLTHTKLTHTHTHCTFTTHIVIYRLNAIYDSKYQRNQEGGATFSSDASGMACQLLLRHMTSADMATYQSPSFWLLRHAKGNPHIRFASNQIRAHIIFKNSVNWQWERDCLADSWEVDVQMCNPYFNTHNWNLKFASESNPTTPPLRYWCGACMPADWWK